MERSDPDAFSADELALMKALILKAEVSNNYAGALEYAHRISAILEKIDGRIEALAAPEEPGDGGG